MRTVFLVGVAAASLMLSGQASANHNGSYAQGGTLDYGVSYPTDARVYTGAPDRYPAEADYRTYDAPPPAYDPYADGYRTGMDQRGGYDPYEMEERERYWLQESCRPRKLSGAGTVLGGIIGGVGGNLIAKRGDRTVGTILGAVFGGSVGTIIEQAANKKKCRAYLDEARYRYVAPTQSYAPPAYQPPVYHHAPRPAPAPTYHHGGGTTVTTGMHAAPVPHGYYTPGYVVTTVITQNPAPVVVTEHVETVTSVRYETVKVPVRTRHAPKKKAWKPRPKPRCTCR